MHYFSAIFIKRRVFSLISVLPLKDNTYFTNLYNYKYSIEISGISIDLESKFHVFRLNIMYNIDDIQNVMQ